MRFVLTDSPPRLEKMIADLRSPQAIDDNPDPTTNFWTIYNKVADEYDEGIVSIRDIPRLESLHPEVGFLRVLSDAMEKTKPSHVRQAAYDVVLAAQDE